LNHQGRPANGGTIAAQAASTKAWQPIPPDEFQANHHGGAGALPALRRSKITGALPQIGRTVVKIGRPQCMPSSCGDTARAQREFRKKPMNAQPEKIEQPEPDDNLAAVTEVEAGIRDFVRNDIAYLRRPGLAAINDTTEHDAAVTNVNSLIQRVAGASLGEIEGLINELERLRDMLHSEGQRVQREIAGYAQLSHAAMKSTRIIAENMAQWKNANAQVRQD
jgi:hypothetical protein